MVSHYPANTFILRMLPVHILVEFIAERDGFQHESQKRDHSECFYANVSMYKALLSRRERPPSRHPPKRV